MFSSHVFYYTSLINKFIHERILSVIHMKKLFCLLLISIILYNSSHIRYEEIIDSIAICQIEDNTIERLF